MSPAQKRAEPSFSTPWFVAALVMVAIIWGHSLVPGTGSSAESGIVLSLLKGVLTALGLPAGWLTEFMVRKSAHFLSNAILGFLFIQAFDPGRTLHKTNAALALAACLLTASIDETIQLSVPGRTGRAADALLDVCGACAAVVIRTIVLRARARD